MTRKKRKPSLLPGYRFLYQLLISCWINDITNNNDIKKILQYAINNYNFQFRKNTKVTDKTLGIFTTHIKDHIPELRMIQGSNFEIKNRYNSIIGSPIFKLILLLERETAGDDSLIFKRLYPTDTLLEEIKRELKINC